MEHKPKVKFRAAVRKEETDDKATKAATAEAVTEVCKLELLPSPAPSVSTPLSAVGLRLLLFEIAWVFLSYVKSIKSRPVNLEVSQLGQGQT